MPPSTDGSWRPRQSYGPLANVTALGILANDELGLNRGPDRRQGRRGSGKSLRFYILGKRVLEDSPYFPCLEFLTMTPEADL